MDLYARAIEVVGEEQLVDVVMVVGCDTMVSRTLSAFAIELPSGAARCWPRNCEESGPS